MSEDDQQQHFVAAIEGLDQWSGFLDMMEGFVNATIARGYTVEQAGALVVYTFTGGKAAQ